MLGRLRPQRWPTRSRRERLNRGDTHERFIARRRRAPVAPQPPARRRVFWRRSADRPGRRGRPLPRPAGMRSRRATTPRTSCWSTAASTRWTTRTGSSQSVAIRNGKFVYVGHDGRPASPNATVIDLRGRTVVPGMVEGHDAHRQHVEPGRLSHADRERDVDQPGRSRSSPRAGPACPKASGSRRWAAGTPTSSLTCAARRTRCELDAAVSDRPVMLFFQFTGPACVNSLGKAFLENVTSPLAGPVTVSDNGTITAGLQSTTGAVSPARAPDVRGQAAQHARRDGVLGERSASPRTSTRRCSRRRDR